MYCNFQSDWLIWCVLKSVSGCPKKVLCFSFWAWSLGKSRVFCVLYLSKSATYKTSSFTLRGKGGRWPILQNTNWDPGFTTTGDFERISRFGVKLWNEIPSNIRDLPKRNLRSASQIASWRLDCIEMSLIVEKVWLTVKWFLYKSIGFFRTPSIPFSSFLSRFNVIEIKLW